jgi:mercuric reductase
MSNKVSRALAHLNSILPLAGNYRALAPDAAQAHRFVLQTYLSSGRAPLADELSEHFVDVANILHDLQQSDLVVLDDNGAILGAYPFTSEARVHQVMIGQHNIHCMCALDALAISPMFRQPAQVRSQCVLSAAPVFIDQSGETILNSRDCAELFLAIDWSAACGSSSCADSLCGQMNFISGSALARTWQLQKDQHEIFTLPEAIEFASAFFIPLIPELQAA